MSRSRDRMVLLRARRRRGLRFVGIEVRDAEVSELVKRGFLAEEDRNASLAIRDGLHRFLDSSLTQYRRTL
jgi:hypothetical protein